VTTPSAEGAYKIWVATVDKNTPTGTEGTIVSRPFSQTTSSKPLIYNLTSPATTYSGPLQINLSASGGGKNVTKINYRILGVSDSGWKTLNGVVGAPGVDEFTISSTVSTSFTFNTATYTSETTTDILVEVEAVNETPTLSDKSQVYYRADNTKPDVTITSPIAGTTINGIQTISGTANDWSTVEAIYFGYFTSDNTPDMINDYATRTQLNAGSSVEATTDKWFKVSSPSLNWNYSFDTSKVYDDKLNHPNYYFYVAALDKSGNVNYTTMKYIINQDMDMPIVTISNPSYNGADNPTAKNASMLLIPKTYVMTGKVRDQDSDGIYNVYVNIDLLKPNGDLSVDIDLTANGSVKYNNEKGVKPELADYYATSSFSPMIIGGQETSWTYKITEFSENIDNGFYKLSVIPLDVNGKIGAEVISYFEISNVGPQIEILSPSIADPDGTSPFYDMYGTVISNVKDDMYWDANGKNNRIYYDDDSTRNKWGWDYDLSQDTFNIHGGLTPHDPTRTNYYRMIFRAKDNGRINTVRISVDGGITNIGRFNWSGDISSDLGSFTNTLEATNNGKIVKMDVMKRPALALAGDYLDYTYSNMTTPNDSTTDWIYFFVDIDTTKIAANTVLKVLAVDNDLDMPHETTASIQVNVDNSAPTGSVKMWGVDSLDPSNNFDFSKTQNHEFIGGDLADVGAAGVRYANLYFWNNQNSNLDATPDYNGNTGNIDAVVDSNTYKVTIPENLGVVKVTTPPLTSGQMGDVLPTNTDNNYPNTWIRAYKYLSSGWRIKQIYTNNESPSDADGQPGTYYGISTKYGTDYPVDGKKLICLEIVDNAGNKTRNFYEHTFSEYPPTVMNANISWASLPEESVTDETTGGRKWIGGTFSMNGFVRDYVAGTNPNPGIERVRVYIMKDDNGDGVPESTQKIYTSKATDTAADPKYSSVAPSVVINTTPALPTATDAQVEWGFSSAQDIETGFTDGAYMIMVEVRDKTGSTDTMKQYVYIDNSDPTLVVSQPTTAQTVKGDLFVISGTASDVAGGGFDADCVNIKILDATTDALKREWNASLDPADVTSPYDWSQDWSLISDASDDFDASESRKVRVTLMDKSGNIHQLADIIVKKGAPPSWPVFTANGSSTAFANATFKSKYTTIGASDPLFMIRNANSVFTTQITDTVNFTGAELNVTGYRQSDGVYLSSATSGFESLLATKYLDPSQDVTNVGQNTSYTYAGLPDGEYAYKVKLHQEAAEINMQKYFIVDNTKPNIWVKKIENTDFNGYGTSTLNGHVDASHDDWGAGYTTGADAVSGVIQLQVKVKDNYLLKNIKAKMTSYSFGTGDNTDVILLQRDASGVWGTPASRGALGDLNYFAVKDVVQSLGTDYDYVVFTLEFNTANLTGVAGINKTLQFTAEDWVGNTTNEAGTNEGIEKAPFDLLTYTSSMNLTYAKPVAFTLDVVPYISSIKRNATYNTERSKSGYYPLLRGEANNKAYGYNLNTGDTFTISPNKTGVYGATFDITGYTVNTGVYTELTFTTPATARSGWLRLEVSNVEITNNVNNNLLTTNKEDVSVLPKTEFWDDDRYIYIWRSETTDFFQGPVNNTNYFPIFPAMSMDGDGDLYASFSNYSTASVYYSLMGAATATRIFYTYDPSEETDIFVTGTGAAPNIHVLYSANYHGGNESDWISNVGKAGGLYLYDNNAPAMDPGRTTQFNFYRFELFYHDKMLQQFQNFSVIRGTNDRMHIAYYDRVTSSIKYSRSYEGYDPGNDAAENIHEIAWVNIDGSWDAHDNSVAYTLGTSIYLTAARFEGGLARTNSVGDNYAIAIDEQNYPAIVYLDTSVGNLRLARSNNLNPTTNTTWTVQSILDATDDNIGLARDYITAKFDTSGILHIAFRNSKGELVYVNSKADVDGGAALSFNKSVVIDTDGMWADITLRGTTPYISYMSKINAYDGIKLAFYDSALDLNDDGNSGDWDYMTASLNYKASNVKTCIESNPDLTLPTWNIAIGYTPGDRYRAAYYIGKD
ncbi:MAG: hypothetical protein KA885_02170, partial [Spirochaetes bacterium]|nr:hypothetical protein [Spirochaetota bacterium]